MLQELGERTFEQLQWLCKNCVKHSLQQKLQTHATALDSTVFCRVSRPLKGNGLLAYEALLGHTHMFCRHRSKSVHLVLLGSLENSCDWRDKFWPVLPTSYGPACLQNSWDEIERIPSVVGTLRCDFQSAGLFQGTLHCAPVLTRPDVCKNMQTKTLA